MLWKPLRSIVTAKSCLFTMLLLAISLRSQNSQKPFADSSLKKPSLSSKVSHLVSALTCRLCKRSSRTIATQLQEKKSSTAMKMASHEKHEVAENINTRVFLRFFSHFTIKIHLYASHRRLTAQAIAGRLFEGLKNDYKCFLDSETQFKIHDLETIVKNTSYPLLQHFSNS